MSKRNHPRLLNVSPIYEILSPPSPYYRFAPLEIRGYFMQT